MGCNIVLHININIKNSVNNPGYVRNYTVNAKFEECLIQFISLYFPFHLGSKEIYDENLCYIWVMNVLSYFNGSIFSLQVRMSQSQQHGVTENKKKMKDWGLERGVKILEVAKVDKIIATSRGVAVGRKVKFSVGRKGEDELSSFNITWFLYPSSTHAAAEIQLSLSRRRNDPGAHWHIEIWIIKSGIHWTHAVFYILLSM